MGLIDRMAMPRRRRDSSGMFRPEGFDDGVGELAADHAHQREISSSMFEPAKPGKGILDLRDGRESAAPADPEEYARQVREAADAYARQVRAEIDNERSAVFRELAEFRRQSQLEAEEIRQQAERELQRRRRALDQLTPKASDEPRP